MDDRYADWLRAVVPSEVTWRTKLSELSRVERTYGDLDTLYEEDELESLVEEFTYSAADARAGRENPTKLTIDGDVRNNLASYKSAIRKYVRFRQDIETQAARSTIESARHAEESAQGQLFDLEKDLQSALRAHLVQLEAGLEAIDGGIERSVPSGRIDILAEDANGCAVVVELKAVPAKREVLGQIAAYMADIHEESGSTPRGIIVAPEFDDKLVSGARMIQGLKLVRYRFRFDFEWL